VAATYKTLLQSALDEAGKDPGRPVSVTASLSLLKAVQDKDSGTEGNAISGVDRNILGETSGETQNTVWLAPDAGKLGTALQGWCGLSPLFPDLRGSP
jgi:hypothetical protein